MPFALDGAVADAVRGRPLLRKMCRAALLSPGYCASPIRSLWNGASARVTYRLRYNVAYTRDYYVAHADMPECQSWHRNIIRPADMGASICYALGATSWEQVCKIQGCDDSVSLPPRGKTSAAEQAEIISSAGLGRKPGLVYDMGCGRGEVAATLIHMGISAVAVDPAHAAGALVDETAKRFYGLPAASVPFERSTAFGALRRSSQTPDTVIFCESVEHMPLGELFATFEWIRDHTGGARGGGGGARHRHELAKLPPDQGPAGRLEPCARRRRRAVRPPCIPVAKDGRAARLAPGPAVLTGGGRACGPCAPPH